MNLEEVVINPTFLFFLYLIALQGNHWVHLKFFWTLSSLSKLSQRHLMRRACILTGFRRKFKKKLFFVFFSKIRTADSTSQYCESSRVSPDNFLVLIDQLNSTDQIDLVTFDQQYSCCPEPKSPNMLRLSIAGFSQDSRPKPVGVKQPTNY